MMRTPIRVFAIVLVVCFLSPLSWSQEKEVEVTRADLAVSYLRLETVLKNVTMDDETAARVNQGFDRATLRFFARQFGAAIKGINEVTASLDTTMDDDALAAVSLRTRIEPPVYILKTKVMPTLHIDMLYPEPVEDGDYDLKADIVLISANGKVAHRISDVHVVVGPDRRIKESIPLGEAARNLQAGKYDVGFELKNGRILISTSWVVVHISMDVIAAANKARFRDVVMADDSMEQAIATVLARNALITDKPSMENSAEFLIDPNILAFEVAVEMRKLSSHSEKENPYTGRTGDYWRVLKVKGKKDIPLRVYLPESVDVSEPYPLVVAFHGAGGDENMFMDAYGAGKIKELAEEHGFLLVSPLTYSFNGDAMGRNFALLLKVIGSDYNVDTSRIYAIGHSMGGSATANLLNIHGKKLAAAVPICGFQPITADPASLPPIRVYAASLDPIVAPSRIKPAVDASIEAGVNIEYTLVENWGHTLTVGKVLPEAIEWMLQYSRD